MEQIDDFVEDPIELQQEIQSILAEFPVTFTTNFRVEQTDTLVVTIETVQFGERYGGEVAQRFPAEETQLFCDQIARTCRRIVEACLPDDAPDSIEDERDEPYFIDSTCKDCGGKLGIEDEFLDIGAYDIWHCTDCNKRHVDQYQNWDELV